MSAQATDFATTHYAVMCWPERGDYYVINRETGNAIGDTSRSQATAERWALRCQDDYDAGRTIGDNTHAPELITTEQAARALGVSVRRIQALITGTPDARATLPAEKYGRDWLIKRSDLARIADRKPGRSAD